MLGPGVPLIWKPAFQDVEMIYTASVWHVAFFVLCLEYCKKL